MRIKYEKNLDNLRLNGVILMEKTADEENRSKDLLDQKLKVEQNLLDLNEDLAKRLAQHSQNRDDLIKLRVKDSTLDTQAANLNIEEQDLTKKQKDLEE